MEILMDEVESLEAILMEDVRIERDENDIPKVIETTIFPLLGEHSDQQYVCVTLQVLPASGYPDVSPDFKLLRPRGLDDRRLETIKQACLAKIQESSGFAVVFDLIEVVREHLTGSNLPSGQCVVCLYGFCDGDEFIRTECFHYLHSYCLGRHINAMRCNYCEEYNKLPAWQQKDAAPFKPLCPVCREPIKDNSDTLRCAIPPRDLENAPDFKPTQELRELQQRMCALFLEQKSRGAIIDADTEAPAVISIETDEEINRRTRHRRDEATFCEHSGSNNSRNNHALSGTENASNNLESSSCSQEIGSFSEQQKQNDMSSSANTTKTVPVVQQDQRNPNDSTNNNYHSRRYLKGGRRHHHHHHHQHQQTQRDRERFQHHHIPSSSMCSSSNNTAASQSSSSSQSSSHSNISKQTKGHIGGNAHNR